MTDSTSLTGSLPPGLSPEQEADLAAARASMPESPSPSTAPGEASPVADPSKVQTKDLLSGLLSPLFALLAPAWGIKPAEVDALSGAWAPVLDKYFPGLDLGIELNAVLITAMVLAPCWKKPRRDKAKEQPAKPADGANAAAPCAEC